MNKTQKEALCNLILWSVLLLFGFILFGEIAFLGRIFPRFHLFYCLLIISLVVGYIIFIRKKQSAVEVGSDERDNLIKLRAVLVSFVSVWILLAVATIIPRFIVGITGSITVWVLSIINFVIFLLAMVVYHVAVLVQYGRGGKDGEK